MPEFESSSKALAGVKADAEAVVELGRRTSNDVSQLRRDIEALLNKMKDLKDKISESSQCLSRRYSFPQESVTNAPSRL